MQAALLGADRVRRAAGLLHHRRPDHGHRPLRHPPLREAADGLAAWLGLGLGLGLGIGIGLGLARGWALTR